MKLNELRDNPGAREGKKRLGRGIGSGLGKTSGKGHKGAKARAGGGKPAYFEGGQMPLYRRLPKRGFNNIFALDINEVNLARLQQAVDAGKLDAAKPVTVEALVESGVLSRVRDGVKILGRGELTTKLDLQVRAASKSVVDAIEKLGGTVTLLAPKTDADAA